MVTLRLYIVLKMVDPGGTTARSSRRYISWWPVLDVACFAEYGQGASFKVSRSKSAQMTKFDACIVREIKIFVYKIAVWLPEACTTGTCTFYSYIFLF